MKNKSIPTLALLFLTTLSAFAQVDTVVTNFHLQGIGWVKQIGDAKGELKMKLETEPGEELVRRPMKDISYIRFSDGFRLDFIGGTAIRDNLLECPTLTPHGANVMVEGLLQLNKDEIRALLGPEIYNLSYKPAHTLYNCGLVQAGIGAAGLFTGIYYLGLPMLQIQQHYTTSTFRGWSVPIIFFSGGMIAGGLGSSIIGERIMAKTVKEYQTVEPHSRLKAKAELFGGLGCVALGAGGMAYGYYDMMKKHKARQAFPTGSVVLIGVGAVLANVGITAMLKGSIYLGAWSKYSAQLSILPSPAGGALVCRF